MTVRIPSLLLLDQKKLAAILTPALLAPARDDAPQGSKAGTSWVRWGEAHASPRRAN